jgi:hypothetical protein
MTTLIAVFGAVVAVAAAVRSTWSPCGLSMLSSITPFGERSRGHRYGVTAAWFVVGSTLGGACLGALAAALAAVAAAGHLSSHPAWLAGGVALVAAGAVAVDAGLFGELIPIWRRQVNDAWLSRYRSWVYGGGFGWQLGVGLATYIMTAAVFLVPLLAGATADPLTAFGICALYGLFRGVAVLVTSRAKSPAQLRALHRRFAELGPTVRWGVIAVEMTVLVAVLAAQWPLAGAAVAGAGAAGAAGLVLVGSHQADPADSRRRGLRTHRP